MEIIEEYKEQLIQKILILNETLWENRVKRNNIENWLSNFNDDNEKINALFLLSQFMYFGNTQMREMLRVLYRDLYKYPIIEKIRRENGDTTDHNLINVKFQEELKNTRFLGVGNPSESGTHLLYYFRQENKLPKNLFINTSDIFKSPTESELKDTNINNYIFIDDFCGSGSQAKRYSKKIVNQIKSRNPNANVAYLMLFSTKIGKEFILEKTEFDSAETVFEFDDTFKCFSLDSRYYKSPLEKFIDKELMQSICEKHGYEMLCILWEMEKVETDKITLLAHENKLGFGNCQLLLGLFHNTPDNTLPIFWFSEKGKDWYPIFKRYNKIY